MKTILVPVDFSEVSQEVARIAGGLGKALSATVELLHVLPPNYEAEEAGRRLDSQKLEHLFPKDAQLLEDLAVQIRSLGCSVNTSLAEGKTLQSILHEADRVDADLIIMGSHGHTSLYHLLVGSVSEGVIHKSSRPVLLVPSQSVTKHRQQKPGYADGN